MTRSLSLGTLQLVYMEGYVMPTRAPSEDEVQVHLHLERDLWRKVKVRAAQDSTSAVAVVREALQEWLRKGGKR